MGIAQPSAHQLWITERTRGVGARMIRNQIVIDRDFRWYAVLVVPDS